MTTELNNELASDRPKSSNFGHTMLKVWQTQGSMLCVGLDPNIDLLPHHLQALPMDEAVYQFCVEIANASAEYACSFKPQMAYFAALGLETVLQDVIGYIKKNHAKIPVILDAKRGDIGSTAEQYAREAFERYNADAVTVNPYMGWDTIVPYLQYQDRGVIVLCLTSNPGSQDLQMLTVGSAPLYQHVANLIHQHDLGKQCAMVVGATHPEQLAHVRSLVPSMPLLVPGIGAQGGDVQATVAAGLSDEGWGLMINSSRAIIFASRGEDYAAQAGLMAKQTHEAILQAREWALNTKGDAKSSFNN